MCQLLHQRETSLFHVPPSAVDSFPTQHWSSFCHPLSLYRGHYMPPTQTMHKFSREISWNYHTFPLFDPPQNGSHLVTPAIFGTKERGSFTGFAHTSFKCLFPTKANQNGHCLERPKHGARGRSSWKSSKIFFRNMRSICWHIRL